MESSVMNQSNNHHLIHRIQKKSMRILDKQRVGTPCYPLVRVNNWKRSIQKDEAKDANSSIDKSIEQKKNKSSSLALRMNTKVMKRNIENGSNFSLNNQKKIGTLYKIYLRSNSNSNSKSLKFKFNNMSQKSKNQTLGVSLQVTNKDQDLYKMFIQNLAMKKYQQCKMNVQNMDKKIKIFALKLLKQKEELQNQIEQKQKNIAKIQKIISDNQIQISNLNNKINYLNLDINELSQRNEQLQAQIYGQRPSRMNQLWDQIQTKLKEVFRNGIQQDILQIKELISPYKILTFNNPITVMDNNDQLQEEHLINQILQIGQDQNTKTRTDGFKIYNKKYNKRSNPQPKPNSINGKEKGRPYNKPTILKISEKKK